MSIDNRSLLLSAPLLYEFAVKSLEIFFAIQILKVEPVQQAKSLRTFANDTDPRLESLLITLPLDSLLLV